MKQEFDCIYTAPLEFVLELSSVKLLEEGVKKDIANLNVSIGRQLDQGRQGKGLPCACRLSSQSLRRRRCGHTARRETTVQNLLSQTETLVPESLLSLLPSG